jgi:hypothetical protein
VSVFHCFTIFRKAARSSGARDGHASISCVNSGCSWTTRAKLNAKSFWRVCVNPVFTRGLDDSGSGLRNRRLGVRAPPGAIAGARSACHPRCDPDLRMAPRRVPRASVPVPRGTVAGIWWRGEKGDLLEWRLLTVDSGVQIHAYEPEMPFATTSCRLTNRHSGHPPFSGMEKYLYMFRFMHNIHSSTNVYKRGGPAGSKIADW